MKNKLFIFNFKTFYFFAPVWKQTIFSKKIPGRPPPPPPEYQMIRPLRSAQVVKQEADEIGYEGKDVAEYVKQHQAADRDERAFL